MYVVPAAFAIGAMVLNSLVFAVPPLPQGILPKYPTDSMTGLLTAVVGSMMTVTGIVFSVLMLTVQHAGASISPRVVRTFYRDRVVKYSLGFFVGTFTFALLTIADIGTSGGPLATGVSLVLVLSAIILFLYMINHVGQTLRSASMIGRVATATHRAIETVYRHRTSLGVEHHFPAMDEPHSIPQSGPTGTVIGVNWAGLQRIAQTTHNPMRVLIGVGDPVTSGECVVETSRPVSSWMSSRILDQIAVGEERAIDVDPAFGIRILVDTAIKALSPGVNDPTTAVMALDQVEALLADLGSHDLSGVHSEWLRGPATTWNGVVDLALTEITFFGARSFQVTRRLMALLDDLMTLPQMRRPALERHRDQVIRRVHDAYDDPGDIAFALGVDQQGISTTAEMRSTTVDDD